MGFLNLSVSFDNGALRLTIEVNVWFKLFG